MTKSEVANNYALPCFKTGYSSLCILVFLLLHYISLWLVSLEIVMRCRSSMGLFACGGFLLYVNRLGKFEKSVRRLW